RPAADTVVVRKVDSNGTVSFAGANYRVGNTHKRRLVEVSLAGDTVQIWQGESLLRTHPIRHERSKEHGAFAQPGGHPRRINAA
ncbi:MAG TPA: IS481 family transposase, partial [Acidimicrobiales bacterium]|nr:IS481 family transposase [Acidimicrobiales bacterium]